MTRTMVFIAAKVYLPSEIYRQIRLIAAAEGVSRSRVMATILRAFFWEIPTRFEDETSALTDGYHRAAAVQKPKARPRPVKETFSRVKIGDRDPAGYPTSAGLSSQPEDNGPNMTEMMSRNRSPRR